MIVAVVLVAIAVLLFLAMRLPLSNRAGIQTSRGPVLVRDARVDIDLVYRDFYGEETNRRVTVHELQGTAHRDGSVTLTCIAGYCHLRKAPRTFRFDRMVQASDSRTGELGASPTDLVARLCGLKGPIRPSRRPSAGATDSKRTTRGRKSAAAPRRHASLDAARANIVYLLAARGAGTGPRR